MVGILAKEADHHELEARFGDAEATLCSAVSLWETARALATVRAVPIATANSQIESFIREFAVRHVPIGNAEGRLAIATHHRYGKGRHPAKLNMGDCFAYACARTNNASLLYKGDDFIHTDLA